MMGGGAPGRSSGRYGWVIVGVLAITETVSWGILYYTFSVFITPMERELGWSRTETAGAYSVALAAAAVAAVPVGRWLDIRGPRGLMTGASGAGVALILAWSQVHQLVALYVIWAGMGVVMAALLYEAAFTVVTKWFIARRRAALTVVTLMGGLASFIFLPLANVLIESLGWRPALVALAAIFGTITLPLHLIFLRAAPDRVLPADPASTGRVETGVSARKAIGTRQFWLLAVAFGISSFLTATLNVHLVAYLVGSGYPMGFAALAAGIVGAMQVTGRVLFATALRSLPRWAEPVLAFSLQGASVLLLGVATGAAGVVIAVILFGLGNGMATLVRALTFAEAFGARWYGTVGGLAGAVAVGARAIAPISVAVAFDAIGSYRPVFFALAGGSIIAVLAGRAAHAGSAWSSAGPDR
jgi:MFS family permease